MLFDDRLATVLRLRGDSPAIARIQYRQLVDLLGSRLEQSEPPLSPTLEAAHARLVELGRAIPAEARAAILRDPALRLTDPALVALLAQDEPAVAQAAICLARLDEAQWLDLAPALPLHARGAMCARRDLGPMVEARMAQLGIGERTLPPVDQEQDKRPPTREPRAPAPAPPDPGPGPAPAPPASAIWSGGSRPIARPAPSLLRPSPRRPNRPVCRSATGWERTACPPSR